MKKILAILAVLFIIPAAGCRNSQDAEAGASSSAAGSTPSGSPSASAYSTVSTGLTPGRTPGLSPEKTLSPTAPPTGSAGQSAAVSAGTPALTPGKTDKITPKPTNTPIKTPSPSSDAAQRAGYTANNIVGVDRYGRTFDSIGGERENKQVGMFFWLWLGVESHGGGYGRFAGVYDASKIIEEYGRETVFMEENPKDEAGNAISPNGQAHWWGEPLWGYYRSDDEYVIRKQMELLTIAGIDFIYFDATNAITYRPSYTPILKVIDEMLKEGWDAPKVVFYTHSRSMQTTKSLYNELYSRDLYPDTWYRVNGKPLIIAYTDKRDDMSEAISRGDTSYKPQDYSEEILNFFTFKRPQWPSDPVYPDGFPWVEWTYPQPKHGDVMNVTVAAHPNVPMSLNLIGDLVGGEWKNWGRGYNPITQKNESSKAEEGQFFQYTWDAALAEDPDMISVGGWNEWVAYKQWYANHYMLCDAASMEFSRDIEMMKGGYEDSFYMQLIKNVRAYKGTPSESKAFSKSIDISGGLKQWEDVTNVYRAIGTASYGRNSTDCAGQSKYVMEAPRNNLQEIRVTHDQENIYFYIRAEKEITGSGANWMNIFIGTGSPSLKGWEGYEYVINRSVNGSTGSIERLKEDYTGESAGEARLVQSGEYLFVEIPRSAIGLAGSAEFYFKVADDVEDTDEIMDYYVTGKSLPMGRLSYKYSG